MLAAAIVQDLITVSADLQRRGIPTVVLIDEFAAIAPARVVRLFATARSARMSLVLGTQEHAYLRPAIAGTRCAWITTQQVNGFGLPTETGTRTRGREFRLHPDEIKALRTGIAAVVVPGSRDEPRTASEGWTMRADVSSSPLRLDSPLLRPDDAAKLLAVGTSWIYEAVRTGAMPC